MFAVFALAVALPFVALSSSPAMVGEGEGDETRTGRDGRSGGAGGAGGGRQSVAEGEEDDEDEKRRRARLRPPRRDRRRLTDRRQATGDRQVTRLEKSSRPKRQSGRVREREADTTREEAPRAPGQACVLLSWSARRRARYKSLNVEQALPSLAAPPHAMRPSLWRVGADWRTLSDCARCRCDARRLRLVWPRLVPFCRGWALVGCVMAAGAWLQAPLSACRCAGVPASRDMHT